MPAEGPSGAGSDPGATHPRFGQMHTVAPVPRAFTVHVDVEITRRKRFHLITDAEGKTVFRSRLVGDILEWLRAEEVSAINLATPDAQWAADIKAVATPRSE